ncbi:DUF2189 domain-containing protein [Modicisalibacter xianhensis]|uniref:Uncharacterized membrane protein n=1 Tax=Modicisalibacter xianhensis TaxID=442341 RepID=A0A1I3F7G3_9GAMM|nr:DUF2189 domain-containing protein [Halomonas xianhensis]SFI07147.1 Uncharacterized membrane protein [Halomonas xianhensis]
MKAATNKNVPLSRADAQLVIRRVDIQRPRQWLSAGISDFRAAMSVSLAYGLFWVGLSMAVTIGAFALGLWHWLLPMIAGFMFLGPLVAVGSYGISRSLGEGRRPTWWDAFGAWTSHTGQLAMMGVMMMIFFMAWIRTATLLFALFFGYYIPSPETLYVALFTTAEGLGMLAVGTAIGAVLAFGAFSISVIAIPTLLDRDLTFMEGIEASVKSIARNFRPMLLWAAILTGCTVVGMMTFYIGLAVILPVLGHATWHAYEDLVGLERKESMTG